MRRSVKAETDYSLWLDFVTRNKPLGNGCQDKCCFHERKIVANTHTRTTPERKVGIVIASGDACKCYSKIE